MNAKPFREVIATPLDRGILAFSHDYPFCYDYPFAYTGWHYHPEYEIHLIRRSSGLFYVGTHAGRFEAGNLVMTGPNLPHMWVTDTDSEAVDNGRVKRRDLVIQFSRNFAEKCIREFADCAGMVALLEQSHAGIHFSAQAVAEAGEAMERLIEASGLERMMLFFQILNSLCRDLGRQPLSLTLPERRERQTKRLNSLLEYIADHYHQSDLSCREIAAREGMALSAFSRFFERHVKCSCLDYLNRLRVYKSCQLLAETDIPITVICYDVGYNSLSTFNRNFSRYVKTSPSEFRMGRRFMPFAHDARQERGSPFAGIAFK